MHLPSAYSFGIKFLHLLSYCFPWVNEARLYQVIHIVTIEWIVYKVQNKTWMKLLQPEYRCFPWATTYLLINSIMVAGFLTNSTFVFPLFLKVCPHYYKSVYGHKLSKEAPNYLQISYKIIIFYKCVKIRHCVTIWCAFVFFIP